MNRYDGPAMARWLNGRRETANLTDARRRTLRHWAAGVNPTESAVDSFLCSVDLHLRDVPAWAAFGWPEIACRGLVIEWNYKGVRYLTRDKTR